MSLCSSEAVNALLVVALLALLGAWLLYAAEFSAHRAQQAQAQAQQQQHLPCSAPPVVGSSSQPSLPASSSSPPHPPPEPPVSVLECVAWSITTLTATADGFRRVVPHSTTGRALATTYMLACFLVTIILGSLLSAALTSAALGPNAGPPSSAAAVARLRLLRPTPAAAWASLEPAAALRRGGLCVEAWPPPPQHNGVPPPPSPPPAADFAPVWTPPPSFVADTLPGCIAALRSGRVDAVVADSCRLSLYSSSPVSDASSAPALPMSPPPPPPPLGSDVAALSLSPPLTQPTGGAAFAFQSGSALATALAPMLLALRTDPRFAQRFEAATRAFDAAATAAEADQWRELRQQQQASDGDGEGEAGWAAAAATRELDARSADAPQGQPIDRGLLAVVSLLAAAACLHKWMADNRHRAAAVVRRARAASAAALRSASMGAAVDDIEGGANGGGVLQLLRRRRHDDGQIHSGADWEGGEEDREAGRHRGAAPARVASARHQRCRAGDEGAEGDDAGTRLLALACDNGSGDAPPYPPEPHPPERGDHVARSLQRLRDGMAELERSLAVARH